ncbi:MAG: hypothetical protein JSV97_01375 [candidate division WOR-3 bacterium]|nr:MAG: hypothetical protein JSV97_01375 [candidate division WOR-3 bacterium]
MPIFVCFLIAVTGFEYLSVDPVAHRVGMGYGQFGDGYSVNYNPAGLAFSHDTYYSSSYLHYIAGTHFGYLGFERSQIGFGVKYFYSGAMKKTDEYGVDNGSFGVHFIDVNVGKGFTFNEIGFGISIKGVYANIDTLNSIGVGVDFGALYIIPGQAIQIGAAIKNIGSSVKRFIDTQETFPYEINIGGIKRFPEGWVGLDLVKPALTNIGMRVGGGYQVSSLFTVKASYTTLLSSLRTGSGLDFLTGLTIGCAVQKGGLTINYSYSPYFDLGGGHRISISLGG